MTENIFDLISDFYSQDSEWNEIIPQKTCEDYIRKLSWKGTDQERLREVWYYILALMLYSGYSATMPGDMMLDDCILCVGWCARNIAEFSADKDSVKDFYDVMIDFYAFMKERKVITHTGQMALAKEKMFCDDKFEVLTPDGIYCGKFKRYNETGIPDLPAKLFIDLTTKMVEVMDLLEGDFIKDLYPSDYKRAQSFYNGIASDGVRKDEDPVYVTHGFNDYFCFDYKLLSTGRPLIEDLSKKIQGDIGNGYSKGFKSCLEELAKAKPMLFIVTKDLGGGAYSVLDIVHNQSHVLMLPLDKKSNLDNMVFFAHIFEDNTIVVNFLRGTYLNKEQLEKMKKLFRKLKQFYAVRKGGKCSWEEFIDNNRLLVRCLPVFLSNKFPVDENFICDKLGYIPTPVTLEKNIRKNVDLIFPNNTFTVAEKEMVLQMWSDFNSIAKVSKKRGYDRTLVAVALARLYVNMCGVLGFDDDRLAEDDTSNDGIKELVSYKCKEIEETLQIKKYDPRYVSEEGMCMMLLNGGAKKNG